MLKFNHYKGLKVQDTAKFANKSVNIRLYLSEYDYWKQQNHECV